MTDLVHPSAIVDDDVEIGAGTRIWHFCHLMSGARLGADVVCGQNVFVGGRVRVGDHCRIQNNVSLYDGVILEDGVFVGPSAVFTNVRRPRARFPRKEAFEDTIVREGATIGANATILCGIEVGACAFVAAGAVVLEDVLPFTMVAGAPARAIGRVCRCGERLDEGAGEELSCTWCARRYRLADGFVTELDS